MATCYNIIIKSLKYAAMAQVVEHVLGKDEVTSSNLVSSSRKNSCSFEQEFFHLYSPSASYIELRSVIFASRVLEANIISLLPKAKISLCRKA